MFPVIDRITRSGIITIKFRCNNNTEKKEVPLGLIFKLSNNNTKINIIERDIDLEFSINTRS